MDLLSRTNNVLWQSYEHLGQAAKSHPQLHLSALLLSVPCGVQMDADFMWQDKAWVTKGTWFSLQLPNKKYCDAVTVGKCQANFFQFPS